MGSETVNNKIIFTEVSNQQFYCSDDSRCVSIQNVTSVEIIIKKNYKNLVLFELPCPFICGNKRYYHVQFQRVKLRKHDSADQALYYTMRIKFQRKINTENEVLPTRHFSQPSFKKQLHARGEEKLSVTLTRFDSAVMHVQAGKQCCHCY